MDINTKRKEFVLKHLNEMIEESMRHHSELGYVMLFATNAYEKLGSINFQKVKPSQLKRFGHLYKDVPKRKKGQITVYMQFLWSDSQTKHSFKIYLESGVMMAHPSGLVEYKMDDGRTGFVSYSS